MEKKCTKCGIIKSIDEFGKKLSYKDGHQYWCNECRRIYRKQYYQKNPELVKESNKKSRTMHHEHWKEYGRKYFSDRYQNDPMFRIMKNQRNRLKMFLDEYPESFSRSIGCTQAFLKAHLESKFLPGMSWSNYGRRVDLNGWEIDHIRPLSSFENLTDPEQFKQAFHYTNLQPLWRSDNRKKSNKWSSKNENI